MVKFEENKLLHSLDDFRYDWIKYQGKNIVLIADSCHHRTIIYDKISDKFSNKIS